MVKKIIILLKRLTVLNLSRALIAKNKLNRLWEKKEVQGQRRIKKRNLDIPCPHLILCFRGKIFRELMFPGVELIYVFCNDLPFLTPLP